MTRRPTPQEMRQFLDWLRELDRQLEKLIAITTPNDDDEETEVTTEDVIQWIEDEYQSADWIEDEDEEADETEYWICPICIGSNPPDERSCNHCGVSY